MQLIVTKQFKVSFGHGDGSEYTFYSPDEYRNLK